MPSQWVYRLFDGLFLRGGFYDQVSLDQAIEGLVEFSDADPHPDPVLERYDAASPTLRRPATQAEQEAVLAERRDLEIDTVLAVKASSRVSWEHRPATDTTTWPQWWSQVKARYRLAQTL